MKKTLLLCGTGVLCLIATGCYNKPETSLKKPGEGPAHYTSGPAVGPGTTAGGSTAGPQPVKREAEGYGNEAAKTTDHGGAHTPAKH